MAITGGTSGLGLATAEYLLEEGVRVVTSEFGTLDVLFANAGITRSAPFEATPEAMYDEVLAVNANGLYFTVQKFAPLMGEGGVVLTTSVANQKALPWSARTRPARQRSAPWPAPWRVSCCHAGYGSTR